MSESEYLANSMIAELCRQMLMGAEDPCMAVFESGKALNQDPQPHTTGNTTHLEEIIP